MENTAREKQSRLESALASRIILWLDKEDADKTKLATLAGSKIASGALHRQFRRLLELGRAEVTIPDRPQSHLQKYNLTKRGRRLLDDVVNGEIVNNGLAAMQVLLLLGWVGPELYAPKNPPAGNRTRHLPPKSILAGKRGLQTMASLKWRGKTGTCHAQ